MPVLKGVCTSGGIAPPVSYVKSLYHNIMEPVYIGNLLTAWNTR